ncbi:MAG: hypothetical protein ACT4P2_01600 [Pseudomonadota bacterium]
MDRLQRFVGALLARDGAVIEPLEPEGLAVLAPPRVQLALGLPEWSQLAFGAAGPTGAQRVGLESDWLDRFAALVGERGRRFRRALGLDNPALGNPERILDGGFALLNATYRLLSVRPAWTRYLILSFRYSARSDERRDGVLRIGFNEANGAALGEGLDRLWVRAVGPDAVPDAAAPAAADLPAPWDAGRTRVALERVLPARVGREIEPFLNSMRRRQERDHSRLGAYFGELRGEALARLAALDAPGGPTAKRQAERERLALRLDSILREYRAKTDDLRQKYAMKVAIEWLQTLEVATPVQRFEVLVRRRKGERAIALDWNPATRALDQAPCAHSGLPLRALHVCDDALHLVGPPACGACTGCGRPYCRACHPRACPKCGVEDGSAAAGAEADVQR